MQLILSSLCFVLTLNQARELRQNFPGISVSSNSVACKACWTVRTRVLGTKLSLPIWVTFDSDKVLPSLKDGLMVAE